MVSRLAMGDITRMKEEGLSPLPEDIIRLNALGLKVERSGFSSSLYELPRVSFLGSDVCFREPTIGHMMWIDSVSRFCDETDFSTYLAIRAFALSRRHEDLPEQDDRKLVVDAIDAFTKNELSAFTINQVHSALMYAMHGTDQTEMEYPARQAKEEDDDENELQSVEDDALSVGAGVLYETMAIGLGLSVRDVMRLPISKAKLLQFAALARNGIDSSKSYYEKKRLEYYVTLDAIGDRLRREKSDG